MSLSPTLLTVTCLLACGGLVAAERWQGEAARRIAKTVASTTFVLLALQLGATFTVYGRLMLLALALGWIGDICLLSRQSKFFLTGLGFFLLSHLAFAAAFASENLDRPAVASGFGALLIVGALTLRWLWPHLSRFYRFMVGAYVLAILVMCALAIGRSAALNDWSIALGALIFMASDLAVARDRFVVRSFWNKAWGLPAYYVAQLLLAWSVASA